ncbi:multidrug effflux MFS transporter [Streptomyces boncukensis]|uniref:multidrug effflux MFS transporter n=1 Tax=Streptomyces boncukensis TaxID=2711219 RepID=UPI0030B9D49C
MSAVLVAMLALLSFVLPLATDMYLPAFPRMTAELATSASGVQLTLTAFMVGLTLGQLVFGPASDRYGRRGLLLGGTATATLATAACALAPTLEWLVALRFVQGFSAAAGLVIARAVVSDVSSGRDAARLFSIVVACAGVAPIAAPLAGGALVGAGGWRTVFWALTAATALMFAGVLRAVPETLPKERRRRKGRRKGGPKQVSPVLAVARDGPYLGYTLAFAWSYAALFAYIGGSSFFYQNVLGLSVAQNSLAFAAAAATVSGVNALNSALVNRFRPEALLRVGLLAMLAGTAALIAVMASGRLGVLVALVLTEVFFAGLGLVVPNATALALARVPESAGAGSAVLGTLQTGLAALVAPFIGVAGDATAMPMVLGMTACSVLAGLALRLSARTARAAE